jgi:hypothetical protein
MGYAAEKFKAWAAPAIFVVFFLTLAPWLYDFPLNDDWAYALGVKHLLEQGRFVLCDWGASTQLTHLLSGSVFAELFGFSFPVLKAYTLTAAAGTIFVFVKILEEFEIKPFDTTLAALVLALNPLFLILANSFMTDLTYLFWMSSASYFYIRHFKTGKPAALISAGLCTAAACLTRQLGIALPIAYTLTLARPRWFWHRPAAAWPPGGQKLRSTLIAVWLFPLIALGAYALWFKYSHGPTWASENYVFTATLKHLAGPGMFAMTTLYRLFAVMMEVGIFLLPMAAGYYCSDYGTEILNGKSAGIRTRYPRAGKKGGMIRGWFWPALAVLAVFVSINGPLPYLENTLSGSGLGVLTLGASALKPSAFFANRYFWYAMTVLSAFSAIFLIFASRLTAKSGNAAAEFLFLSALAHLGISLMGAKFFDRYLVNLFPWFTLAAIYAVKSEKFSRPAAILALTLMAAVGWAGVKDYMQWNRAKWELAAKPGHDLAPGEIVNGFDYEAWFNYEKNMAYLKTMKPLRLIEEWEWQKVQPYKAMISFSPQPGLTIIDSQEYATPLSSRKCVIYLMK